MMKRNWLCTTIVVWCDVCNLCWVYDAPRGATFKAARAAAGRVGWTIIRTPDDRRDLCRYCSPAAADSLAAARENNPPQQRRSSPACRSGHRGAPDRRRTDHR